MGRLLGVVAIFVGAAIMGFDLNRFDTVLVDLPRGSHGVHLHDVIGVALVVVGNSVLWFLPRSAPERPSGH